MADCIENWWHTEGQLRYPDADGLTILADGGGSNGSNCHAGRRLEPVYAIATDFTVTSHVTSRDIEVESELNNAYSANSAKTGQAAHWITQPILSTLARRLLVQGAGVFVPG